MNDGEQSEKPMRIRMLGRFDVTVRGKPLPAMRSRKDYWLFARTILLQGETVLRDSVGQSIWPFPEFAEDQARAYFRRSLWQINLALGEEAFRLRKPNSRTLVFDLDEVEVDVFLFDAAAKIVVQTTDLPEKLRAIEQALTLYRGPLLAECTYEWNWLETEREKRRQAYRVVLEHAAKLALRNESPVMAAGYFQRAVAIEPFYEPALRGLMQASAEAGDVNTAVEAYFEYRRKLRQETNREPDLETTALLQQIQQVSARKAKALAPLPPQPPASPPTVGTASGQGEDRFAATIPPHLHPIIGRERELDAIVERLRTRRMVTLTGAAGIGKTRLAVEIARSSRPRLQCETVFVELARSRDPSAIPTLVAALIGIGDAPRDVLLRQITEFFTLKPMLLALDNCEHLLGSVAEFVRPLLAQCPALRILATSRQSLGLPGETAWCVPSLPLPDGGEFLSEDDEFAAFISRVPSVRLFMQRAQDVQPDFDLTPQTGREIARICCLLDGIPLAIELAAARLRMMSLTELLDRLTDRFSLLALGGPTGLSRGRTIRAAIDWSYCLLEEEEQWLLTRLAVFRGGFTLAAAEGVCSCTRIPRASVEHRLGEIVDRSLIVAEHAAGNIRFRLLEPIRQYCEERLSLPEARGVAANSAWERHAAWFADFCEQAQEYLKTASQKKWLRRIESDYDNIRTALEWSLSADAAPAGMEIAYRLSAALCHFWEITDHCSEARARIAALSVQRCSEEAASLARRAEILTTAALLADYQSDTQDALRHIEEALALARRSESRSALCHSLEIFGWLTRHTDSTLAFTHIETALAMARQDGDSWRLADILSTLGFLELFLERGSQAAPLLYEGLEFARKTGDTRLISEILYHLGIEASIRQEYPLALGLFKEAIQIHRTYGERSVMANRLCHMANCLLNIADLTGAEDLYRESLSLAYDLNLKRSMAEALTGLASVSAARGYTEKAVRLYCSADTLLAGDPRMLFPALQAKQRLLRETTFAKMSPHETTLAQTVATATSLEEVVRLTLQDSLTGLSRTSV